MWVLCEFLARVGVASTLWVGSLAGAWWLAWLLVFRHIRAFREILGVKDTSSRQEIHENATGNKVYVVRAQGRGRTV